MTTNPPRATVFFCRVCPSLETRPCGHLTGAPMPKARPSSSLTVVVSADTGVAMINTVPSVTLPARFGQPVFPSWAGRERSEDR